MVHYFVSVYYNWQDDLYRENLKNEFVKKYPNVILLEPKIEYHTFCNNTLLNKFIRKNIKNLESLTVIDCDIELYPDFFETVINRINIYDYPIAIQPFEKVKFESNSLKVCYSTNYSASYVHCNYGNNHLGETGFIWTFNKKFIEKVQKFPENLVLGSFDYVLYLSLTRQKTKLLTLTNNVILILDFIDFYKKILDCRIGYIPNKTIVHKYHGDRKNRQYTARWRLYDTLNFRLNNIQIYKNYFKSRKEL